MNHGSPGKPGEIRVSCLPVKIFFDFMVLKQGFPADLAKLKKSRFSCMESRQGFLALVFTFWFPLFVVFRCKA